LYINMVNVYMGHLRRAKSEVRKLYNVNHQCSHDIAGVCNINIYDPKLPEGTPL
jgi:hypothetical protein